MVSAVVLVNMDIELSPNEVFESLKFVEVCEEGICLIRV
jgi:hypothetical protein